MESVYIKYKRKYDFSMFKTDSIYKGPLAKPKLVRGEEGWDYRTRIREGCREIGINFAGHYTAIETGCGCECQLTAIIDRINGEVICENLPFEPVDGHYGAEYKPWSRLIITNSNSLLDFKGYIPADPNFLPVYHEFKDGKFIKLK
jgi:hypothetical protein